MTLSLLLMISQFASVYNIDPILVQAIIKVESNYNPKAIGAAGEVGLMQIHPKYHPQISKNPAKNVLMGIKILYMYKKQCYPKFKDAWFICYNLGPNKHLKYPHKFAYYKKVVKAYETISENRRYTTRR